MNAVDEPTMIHSTGAGITSECTECMAQPITSHTQFMIPLRPMLAKTDPFVSNVRR